MSSTEDEFRNTIPDEWDLDSLAKDTGMSASDLARQSLYVKFDPLVGSAVQAATTDATAEAHSPAHPAGNDENSRVDNAGPKTPSANSPLLSLDTPKADTVVRLQNRSSLRSRTDAADTASPTVTSTMRRSGVQTADHYSTIDSSPATPTSSHNTSGNTAQDLSTPTSSSADAVTSGTPTSSSADAVTSGTGNSDSEELQLALMEIEELRSQLSDARAQNKQMAEVVEEYGATMKEMLDREEKSQSQASTVASLEADLRSTETAFADLHRKYERARTVIDNFRSNEEALKTALEQANQALQESEKKYDALKEHAEQRIQEANRQIASVREENKGALSALQAKIKRLELDNGQLKRTLKAKEEDNKELTAICDDLVRQLEGAGGGAAE